jgi:hypothetical protein
MIAVSPAAMVVFEAINRFNQSGRAERPATP